MLPAATGPDRAAETGNGLFGSAEQTGSLGVVTVNCARLGHLHKGNEAGLRRRLDELLDLGRDWQAARDNFEARKKTREPGAS